MLFRLPKVFIALAAAVFTAAGAEPPPLSDRMSLEEIERGLEAFPPGWEWGDQRALIMASLDRHVSVQIRKGWTDEERERIKPLHRFYLRRVDAGLDKLERATVSQGVHVFKFYSSSFILKTAQGTVAIDYCQGPINNGGEPEDRDEYRSGFYCTPAQRDRLAGMVDVQLITHRHHDHADYSLARRLAAQGKPVVGPAQLKAQWKDLAGAIVVPDYGKVQTSGPVEWFTMLGAQFSRNQPTGNGSERMGMPDTDNPDRDSQTVAYLFRTGGITFLACGENHVPAGEWLRAGMALGFTPDVLMSLGQFQGERSLLAELKNLGAVFRLPRHEHEMTHEGGGNRIGPLMTGSNRAAFNRRESMPLLWGEDFHLTAQTVSVGKRAPSR